ncbi:MAG: right-handed parallel beta-helix repeat-containing protein [Lentisphaerae bacterium]|nr:right-handed parallel beta-helix repeat-containing protein [Lentisphaerota bacterium]
MPTAISLAALWTAGCLTTQAATYFVDRNRANASDGNPGTESAPWKTIQHAVDVVQAGDTVYIKSGTYRERIMLTGSSGSEGESGNATAGYITYAGYPGHTVVLDGSGFSGWGCAFMSGKWAAGSRAMNYIRIRDLTIRNYPEHGIDFEENSTDPDGSRGSHHIIIENVTLANCGNEGVMIEPGDIRVGGESHNIILRNCTAYNNGHHGLKFSGEVTGLHDRRVIRDSIIEGNTCYANGWSGSDGLGIHVSTACRAITVRNNTCYNNYKAGLGGHEIFDSVYENNVSYGNGTAGNAYEQDGMTFWNCKNLVVRGNLIYDNPGYGIAFSRQLSGSAHQVYNNVVCRNGDGGISLYQTGNAAVSHNTLADNTGIGLRSDSGLGGNVLKANILYRNGTQVAPGSDTFDYNLYDPNVFFGRKGSHAVSGNPAFADAGNADYRLQPDSPAVDAAVALGIAADRDGTARPQGGGYDIGAYEYTGAAPPPPVPQPAPPSNLRIVP